MAGFAAHSSGATFFQGFLLLIRIALARGFDDRGIDHLPPHGEVSLFLQMSVEPGEQRLDRARLCQHLTKQPDRARIGNTAMQVQPQKAHKAEPVADLELGLLIGKPVQTLQHQHLQHHHRIHRRASTPGAI